MRPRRRSRSCSRRPSASVEAMRRHGPLRAAVIVGAALLILPAGAFAHGYGHRDPAGAFGQRIDARSGAAVLLYAADALPTTWCGTERSTDDTAHGATNGADVKVT